MIIDILRIYWQAKGKNGGKFRPRALKELMQQHFGTQIQAGEHDPVRYGLIVWYKDWLYL